MVTAVQWQWLSGGVTVIAIDISYTRSELIMSHE